MIKHRLKAIQKPIKNELGNREKNTKNAHFVLKKCTFRFRDYKRNNIEQRCFLYQCMRNVVLVVPLLFMLWGCGLWVVGLLGCWVLEDGARRPPSYFSLPSRMGSLCPILQQQARRILAKNGVNIGRSQAKSGARPCNKSGESLEHVVSHRPL